MSATEAPDPARLDELRRRLGKAAYDFPAVDAVVVYQPDLRREEGDREAQNLHVPPANPASEDDAAEHAERTRAAHEAMRNATECEGWVPPADQSVEQLGGQRYWARVILSDECPELNGVPAGSQIWHCTLFGPKARDLENAGLRLFNMLAEEAARLVLPSTAKGKGLIARWLVHLADRPEPLSPDSRRVCLAWPRRGSGLWTPHWVPITPQNRPAHWWAARLPNVFLLSARAIGQATQAADRPTTGALPTAPRRQTKIASAIAMLRSHPEMNDKQVADAVGCDPSTLSGSKDYRAARDAMAAEQAKRLNRSRRSRGNDMDAYSDDPNE